MLDPGDTVIFRPYVYELIDNQDGQFTLWYSVWIPLKDGITARSVTVDFIAASRSLSSLRSLKPPSFCVIGRGEPDPEALIEVWIEEPP